MGGGSLCLDSSGGQQWSKTSRGTGRGHGIITTSMTIFPFFLFFSFFIILQFRSPPTGGLRWTTLGHQWQGCCPGLRRHERHYARHRQWWGAHSGVGAQPEAGSGGNQGAGGPLPWVRSLGPPRPTQSGRVADPPWALGQIQGP